MPGRLVYLMGPSGSGKDSVMAAARTTLERHHVLVVRRVITRSAEAKGEDALSVSPERFEQLCAEGAFALHWQANDLSYGIPVEIDDALRQGRTVLVNGSRAHLAQARQRYPDLLAILLTVEPQVLRQRLLSRGREPLEAIERRLARSRELSQQAPGVHLLDNSARLIDAVERLLTLLREQGALGTTESHQAS
ncbi:phosphonate metabolism protein/1,5-bisphosphokinase (PRPP-forming) PhnN [Pseudomonas sp. NPDC090755]|uniref:phosphonate metabolism protein/1,5-bisphosphokinase (PRPP-forming) PhnN n=1 Tax=Pseudomonas sp. NPDC090755 TaxID=3364481 RepID=UPI00383AD30C